MIRPLISADISISPPEISNFFISRNTDIDLFSDTDIVSNSFNFFGSSRVVLINMVPILMTSTKLATLGLLEIEVFWKNKRNDLINFCPWRHQSNHVNQIKLQIWSCRQGLVTLAFLLWEKLSQPQFYKDLTRKTIFSERCSSLVSSWMIWDWQ